VLLVQSMNELTGAPRLQQIVERFKAASVAVRSLAEQFDSTGPLAAFWMPLRRRGQRHSPAAITARHRAGRPARTLTVSTPPSRSGRPGGRSAGALRRGLRRGSSHRSTSC
jgi:hypothetical protein